MFFHDYLFKIIAAGEPFLCYSSTQKGRAMSMTILSLEKQIAAIQSQLATLGPMRPGTLGMQYRDRKEKLGGFWQISFTHQRRSRSEYVRTEHLAAVREELENFVKFRELTEQWINLSLELSKLKRKQPTTRKLSDKTPASDSKRKKAKTKTREPSPNQKTET